MKTRDRVRKNTAPKTNETLEQNARLRIVRAATEGPGALSRRIEELDEEWDIERWLETNASALALTGTVLGLLVNKKFFAIPCIVLPFLLQHALQGWCPPVPFFRKQGVRTRREIDVEKYALKALRGDFAPVESDGDRSEIGRAAWQAAKAD